MRVAFPHLCKAKDCFQPVCNHVVIHYYYKPTIGGNLEKAVVWVLKPALGYSTDIMKS